MDDSQKNVPTPEPYRVCLNGHEWEHTLEGNYCSKCGEKTEIKQRQLVVEVHKPTESQESEDQLVDNLSEQEKSDTSLLAQRLDVVVGEIQKLQKLFTDRFRYDEAKEKAIEALANELAESSPNHEFSLKKGLVNALISMYDRILDVEKSFEIGTVERERITNLKQELLDKLYMEDIELIKIEDGSLFDYRLQNAVGKVATVESSEDQKIQKVTQEGFIQGERVIRPQSVVVFRYSGQAYNVKGDN